jgi:hypothetical protein
VKPLRARSDEAASVIKDCKGTVWLDSRPPLARMMVVRAKGDRSRALPQVGGIRLTVPSGDPTISDQNQSVDV